MRLDTNYYYWPPDWIQNRPGLFTGSGMPMRFADTDGAMIDVYQAVTQMTDESGQTYPFTIDTLLDRATGPLGYYGAFTANMHTDSADRAGADAIVASAQTRGVPVVSARQMLDWLDGRNGSAFGVDRLHRQPSRLHDRRRLRRQRPARHGAEDVGTARRGQQHHAQRHSRHLRAADDQRHAVRRLRRAAGYVSGRAIRCPATMTATATRRRPDCNDANPAVHPGAVEACNGVDDDCDMQIDEGCPPTPTRTATVTATATATPSATPVPPTATHTATATATASRTATATNTATATPVPPTGTSTATATPGLCGNGNVDPGEQCDDGNTANGDCCSSTCHFEPAGSPLQRLQHLHDRRALHCVRRVHRIHRVQHEPDLRLLRLQVQAHRRCL